MSPVTDAILKAARARHSIYALKPESVVPDARIAEIVKEALQTVPSSFNIQSTRIVLLLKNDHRKLWDIVGETLKPLISEEQWTTGTKPKVDGFRNGYGSILFFEDPKPIEAIKAQFPLYADKFDNFAEHADAMHQYLIWTALEAEGFGANLQHYNPLINEAVAKQWSLPTDWRLVAQMVFGKPAAEGQMPPKKSTDETFKMFGSD